MTEQLQTIYNVDLDRMRRFGAYEERERIIKIIESKMQGRDSWLDVIEIIKAGHND